jgi:pyruvate/2-oxoglutarate/acetoin dehydrogenase E1 component
LRKVEFGQAIESALAQAMAEDPTIFILGEDVHTLRVNLLARFGEDRVRSTPISEGAFVGAAVGAAMAGLRPVAEVMLVDFIAVAMDAVLNHAAKVEAFSGGRWRVPMVIRSACGGGYGDGGQHEQSLWGWLAHIPGISVVVPSNPADAGGLMLTALTQDHPVVYLEHKLLSGYWLDYMGGSSRPSVSFDVPPAGALGDVPDRWAPAPLGRLARVREGKDVTLAGVGVDVHRALAAAQELARRGISAEVLDLRTVAPLDREGLRASVEKTGALVVVDEDYRGFGLSGEVAAGLLEQRLGFKLARVCTAATIPFARSLEAEALPSAQRIVAEAVRLLKG